MRSTIKTSGLSKAARPRIFFGISFVLQLRFDQLCAGISWSKLDFRYFLRARAFLVTIHLDNHHAHHHGSHRRRGSCKQTLMCFSLLCYAIVGHLIVLRTYTVCFHDMLRNLRPLRSTRLRSPRHSINLAFSLLYLEIKCQRVLLHADYCAVHPRHRQVVHSFEDELIKSPSCPRLRPLDAT